MIDFVEECRLEWRRLGVADPIANEMAADLTADIEEAEAEGGSAEDVLGNSVFDPRQFAAAWAEARGVTAPPPPAPTAQAAQAAPPAATTPAPTPTPDRAPRRWPVLAAAMAGLLALIAVAAALIGGRHSAAVAAPVHRILAGPESVGPDQVGPVSPSFRVFGPVAKFTVQSGPGLQILGLILLLVAVMGLGLAALYLLPWSRRRLNLSALMTGRNNGPDRSNR